jgi:DNA-directed RNA polymerase specialized sigma24 family protein
MRDIRMLRKTHRLRWHLHLHVEAKIMLAHTELLKETSDFIGSTHFFRAASRIIWNAFAPLQLPVLFGAHSSQHALDQQVIAEQQDSGTSCDAVSDAMEKLLSEHREILVMVCIEGVRYADAADTLGVTVDTVYARLSCARQELQALLSQRS